MRGDFEMLPLEDVQPIERGIGLSEFRLMELPAHQSLQNQKAFVWKVDGSKRLLLSRMLAQRVINFRGRRQPLEGPQQTIEARPRVRQKKRTDIGAAERA